MMSSNGVPKPQARRDLRTVDGQSETSSISTRLTCSTEKSNGTVAIPDTHAGKVQYGFDENEERGNWTGRLDFILSMLGFAVGLGNIWRFPYLCYRNGGGAFLIPFIVMMAIIGIPLFYMEVCLGQFCSCGPSMCWRFAPLFKGVGVAMSVCSAIVSIYYNVILAWSQFYLFSSFTSTLPWTTCENVWNTRDCSHKLPIVDCLDGTKLTNGTCYRSGEFVGIWNDTMFTNTTGRKRILPSEEYWTSYALGRSSGIDDMGAARWPLALNLLLAWIIAFCCLIKGIKSTGKVVYFTALFPYVVLIILFFRGVTLDDAGKGIYFYIVPRFDRLADAKVWRDAAVQIFYSMGPGWGGLIALSSYNRFHNNALRDSLIVSFGDCLTSIFGGFVIFSYLGHMAGKLKTDVENVVDSGAGLAFIVYPEAVASLPAPPLWSILFFFMLITLGLDSQFAMLETLLTAVLDQFPNLRPKKSWVIFAICAIFFLLGLPMTTSAGVYLLQLMDHHSASWPLLVIGLTETLAISYVYDINRFFKDMELMFGRKPFIWWKICWMAISPVTIVFIMLFAIIDYSPAKYGDYYFPAWAEVLGWFMAAASIIAIPIVMIYKINNEDEADTLLEKLKLLVTPTRSWGPALVKHRRMVDYVNGFVIDPRAEKQSLAFVNIGFDMSRSQSLSKMSSIWNSQSVANVSRTSESNISHTSRRSFESSV